MIAIWPLGVPAFMILMFWRNRRGLAQLRNLQISYDAQVKIDERSGKDVSEIIHREACLLYTSPSPRDRG